MRVLGYQVLISILPESSSFPVVNQKRVAFEQMVRSFPFLGRLAGMAILPLRNNGCPAVGVGKNSDSLIAGSFSVQVLCVGSALECVRKNVIVKDKNSSSRHHVDVGSYYG